MIAAVDSEELNNYTRKANSKNFLEAPIEKVGAFFALKQRVIFLRKTWICAEIRFRIRKSEYYRKISGIKYPLVVVALKK